jgi:hypothetical protein
MNLYLLQWLGAEGWDEAHGFVIAAESEVRARASVDGHCGDECGNCRRSPRPAPCVWLDPAQASCELIGTAAPGVEPCVVLRDFNAA